MNRKRKKLKHIRAMNHLREWRRKPEDEICADFGNGIQTKTMYEFAYEGYRLKEVR